MLRTLKIPHQLNIVWSRPIWLLPWQDCKWEKATLMVVKKRSHLSFMILQCWCNRFNTWADLFEKHTAFSGYLQWHDMLSSTYSESTDNLLNAHIALNITNSQQNLRLIARSWRGYAHNLFIYPHIHTLINDYAHTETKGSSQELQCSCTNAKFSSRKGDCNVSSSLGCETESTYGITLVP